MLRNQSSTSLEPIRKDLSLNQNHKMTYEMNAYTDKDPFRYENVDRYRELLSKDAHRNISRNMVSKNDSFNIDKLGSQKDNFTLTRTARKESSTKSIVDEPNNLPTISKVVESTYGSEYSEGKQAANGKLINEAENKSSSVNSYRTEQKPQIKQQAATTRSLNRGDRNKSKITFVLTKMISY